MRRRFQVQLAATRAGCPRPQPTNRFVPRGRRPRIAKTCSPLAHRHPAPDTPPTHPESRAGGRSARVEHPTPPRRSQPRPIRSLALRRRRAGRDEQPRPAIRPAVRNSGVVRRRLIRRRLVQFLRRRRLGRVLRRFRRQLHRRPWLRFPCVLRWKEGVTNANKKRNADNPPLRSGLSTFLVLVRRFHRSAVLKRPKKSRLMKR